MLGLKLEDCWRLTVSDVFLSPLKPKQKVVSAQDVESSLYYVHIDQPEDELLLQDEQAAASQNQDDNSLVENEDPALPDNRSFEEQTLPSLPPRPFPPALGPFSDTQPGAPVYHHALSRKPVSSVAILPSRLDVTSTNQSNTQVGQMHRKPLTRRPLPPLPTDDPGLAPGDVEYARPLPPLTMPDLLAPTDVPPTLPPRPRQSNSESGVPRLNPGNSSYPNGHPLIPSSADALAAEHLVAASRRPMPSRSGSYFSQYTEGDSQASITLIRRDPSSAAQWNVAKISDPPITEVSSQAIESGGSNKRYKQVGAPIFVEVSTPGYTKFNDRPTSSRSTQTSNNRSFERRMYLEGSRNADHTYGHRKSSSYGSAPSEIIPSSSESLTPAAVERFAPVSRPTDKGYAFLSPWGGKCQFSTGGAGRSVTCRHSIPPPNVSFADSSSLSGPVTVSELRFNLPPASMAASAADKASKRASAMASLGRPRGAPRFHSEFSTSSTASAGAAPISPILANVAADDLQNGRDSFDFDIEGGLARLDLSLGQERAGGGFTGKQAKLGKLILWDEGLKMMDLLVAANVALWWRAYERVERREAFPR